MGVGNSVGRIYAEARKWFRIYIDKDTYVADFEELNHMGNGGVTFGSVQEWIAQKAISEPNSCWTTFRSSGSAIMMSHKAAATHMDSESTIAARKVVDISEFKAFLIHLYANTILWTHYIAVAGHNSDEENFRKKLTLHEFSLACKSLNDAHLKEPLSKDLLRSDFQMLDENCDGLVGFVQVKEIWLL